MSPNPLDQLLGKTSRFGTDEQDGDQEHKDEIMQEHYKRDAFISALEKVREDYYHESDSTNLPPIGSRVRRGIDWSWGNQDGGGPGTVVGHQDDNQVWVEWDVNEDINTYQYGSGGNYDVLIVDEQRVVLAGGKAAVGCVVRPGRDWQKTATDITTEDKGVVVKIASKNPHKVLVRWHNKSRGEYECDKTGKMEVELCDATETLVQHLAAQEDKISKNKNKNASTS